ncbi:hypothetical protein ElyMa_006696800 [Elysia marginata]|uniref:Sulfatase N-terminal domain-containing protein n=1 Tax=Elysia marginata TaxID=1093978 RepID=A0AAV4IRW7_9GAST|nr:hypothetical protein ElyMa_006696800 [Elysia marginata]
MQQEHIIVIILYIFFYDDYTKVVRTAEKLVKNEPLSAHARVESRKNLTKSKTATFSEQVKNLQRQQQSAKLQQTPKYTYRIKANVRGPLDRVSSKVCTFPNTDPFDPDLKKLVKTYPPLDCSANTPNIVYLDVGDVFRVNHSKLDKALSRGQNFSYCWCKEIRRLNGSDKGFEFSRTTELFNESMALKAWQENVVVECFDSSKKVISRSYFPLIRKRVETEAFLDKNYQSHIEINSPLETLSIFMIGIDGMSKQNFERAMPLTRNFLLDKMGAIELYKYNKLAFETFPNVLALLTGHTPEEFYRDWHYNRTEFMDQINEAFLWSDARKLGYRTGMILDCYDITAFHYQKKGFKVSPVDYYQRPTVIASSRDKLMRGNNSNCVGDISEVTQVHDYWLQLARTFGKNRTTPFFGYSFAAHLTHDESDLASKGDEAYLRFLQDLVATGALNNTVLLWFSDHGPRFGPIRESYHGRIETSTPYLFFAFPPWFHRKYPKLIKTLQMNQKRLASHFDVYETLKDLLNFKKEIFNKEPGKLTERGISLFRVVPLERTCANAGIPGEFCACGRFSKVLLSNSLMRQLSRALLDRVNSFISFGISGYHRLDFYEGISADNSSTKDSTNDTDSGRNSSVLIEFRNDESQEPPRIPSDAVNYSTNSSSTVQNQLCAQLSLLGTVSVYYVTNDQLRSSKVKSYRVTIKTLPGLGLFEALVNYEPGKEARVVGDVVRINMYRGQADCVHDPWLRQFCFCVK